MACLGIALAVGAWVARHEDSWPEPYSYIHSGTPGKEDEIRAKLPFDRIQLERTTCFGDCPNYTVTMRRDGTAEYIGGEYAVRQGTFTGEVSVYDYGRLCYLIESQHFEKMQADYSRPMYDLPATYIRVWRDRASEPTTVKDYGKYGPIALWGLQTVIDAMADNMVWAEVK